MRFPRRHVVLIVALMAGFLLSPTDHLAIEAMKMLKATVVDGKGKWEYFDEIVSFGD